MSYTYSPMLATGKEIVQECSDTRDCNGGARCVDGRCMCYDADDVSGDPWATLGDGDSVCDAGDDLSDLCGGPQVYEDPSSSNPLARRLTDAEKEENKKRGQYCPMKHGSSDGEYGDRCWPMDTDSGDTKDTCKFGDECQWVNSDASDVTENFYDSWDYAKSLKPNQTTGRCGINDAQKYIQSIIDDPYYPVVRTADPSTSPGASPGAPAPAKKPFPVALVAGIGGGTLLLIIIIIVATRSNSSSSARVQFAPMQ
jgi:hypothetical protein